MSKNIFMRFCFTVAGPVLSGSLFAAPPEPATAPARVKTVVRADPRTGKLVRIVIAPSADGAPNTAAKTALNATVQRIATEQALPEELLHSVIQVESNYNPAAISPKGARGLMQLMPDTARRFGVPDSFDPVQNIQGGAKYLKYLLTLYGGDYPRALAAYNAGEKAVAKYGGIPPYAETRDYVTRIQGKLEASKPHEKVQTPRPVAAPEAEGADAPRHMREVVAPDGSVRYVTQ
jgi:soluble lytic murein transglycosylase-like protein